VDGPQHLHRPRDGWIAAVAPAPLRTVGERPVRQGDLWQPRQPDVQVAIAGDDPDRDPDDEEPWQHRAQPRTATAGRQRRRIDPRMEQAHRAISPASRRFAQGRFNPPHLRPSSPAIAGDPVIPYRPCKQTTASGYWMPRLKRGMTTRERRSIQKSEAMPLR